MGWETRKGRGAYYTRSRREGGRVVREYIGTGSHAEFMALLDEGRKEEREAKQHELRRQKDEAERVVSILAELGLVAEALTCKALEGAGYHQHKGQWRRRREL